MTRDFDVVGLGLAAVDELLWVERYPAADEKVPVKRRARSCGGVNATALVAAARLGSRSAYAGILGDDEASLFVLEALDAKGVSTDQVHVYPGAGPVKSVIVLDDVQKTRNVFYDLSGVVGPGDDWMPPASLSSTRVVLIDNFRMDFTIKVAQLARSNGAEIVADFEGPVAPRFDELVALVDHLIISTDFARAITGEADLLSALSSLKAPGRTVVVTCGADGAWYTSDIQAEPIHQPAYVSQVVDTNGSGDVFHGAYAHALAEGLDLAARVRMAAATAALAAGTEGGQEGIPDTTTLVKFLEEGP